MQTGISTGEYPLQPELQPIYGGQLGMIILHVLVMHDVQTYNSRLMGIAHTCTVIVSSSCGRKCASLSTYQLSSLSGRKAT